MTASIARAEPKCVTPDTEAVPFALSRHAALAFWGSLVIVAVLGLALALGNNLPGHWDSINNLATARNLAEGRGFVSDIVQQLATPESLPGPETVRAPGVPYLMAAVFRVVGFSYAAPVLVSLAIVVATALCLRQAVREASGGFAGDLIGALVLLTHRTFELRSVWNNGVLALLTAFLLLLMVHHLNGKLRGWRFAIACALVAAAGFLTKQTFMLGAVPFAIGLLASDVSKPRSTRVAHACVFLALFAALTAPYWATNLMEHGQALYSPIQDLRLPTRYGILGTDRFHRTVRFGAENYSYGQVIGQIGVASLLARELAHWARLVITIVMQNPFVVVAAALGLTIAGHHGWRLHAALVSLAIPPVFDSSYWIVEPRYLFPLFPLSLFLAWMSLRGWRERASIAGGWPRRERRLVDGLTLAALLWSGVHGARQWRWDLIASRYDAPGWVNAVRTLKPDAIVMTAAPPEVNWYTRRVAVIAPVGSPEDLARTLERYRPTHYLDVEPQAKSRRVPFAPGELEPLASAPDWRLFRIVTPATSLGSS